VQYRRQCDNGRGGDADSGHVPAQSRRARGFCSISLIGFPGSGAVWFVGDRLGWGILFGLWERRLAGNAVWFCRSAAPGAKTLAARPRLLQNRGRVKGWEQGDNESPPKQNETNT